MIQKALEYIVGLKEPFIKDINGETYSDKSLNHIKQYIPMAREVVEMHTLTSFVDYIKAKIDWMPERMIIQVESPTRVLLYSALNDNRDREKLVTVTARVPGFEFDTFQKRENFTIGMQAKFMDTEDKALLLKFAGTVESGTITQYSDDGVSQSAVVKDGIAHKQEALVPSPAVLKPYRTFIEVEQPESSFIFRMKEDKYDKDICCGLFEADGGAWMSEATERIKAYLMEHLSDMPEFIIIA